MKVILLQDIKGTGKKGQIIEASDGHARNYLIPRKMAVEATKINLNELEGKQKSEEHKFKKELEKEEAIAKQIEGKTVKLALKIGGNGKLFGAITSKEIALAIKEQINLEIDKKKILLPENIKSLGEYKIEIKLHHKITATLTLRIEELLK